MAYLVIWGSFLPNAPLPGLHQVAAVAGSLMGPEEPGCHGQPHLQSLADCLLNWGPLSPLCGGWRDSRGSDGRLWVHFDLN